MCKILDIFSVGSIKSLGSKIATPIAAAPTRPVGDGVSDLPAPVEETAAPAPAVAVPIPAQKIISTPLPDPTVALKLERRWRYEQKTGNLYLDGKLYGTGFSGNGPGMNNVAYENTAKHGPLPRGYYRIGKQQDNVTGSGHKLVSSMRLTPIAGFILQTHRDGFLIHGDSAADISLPLAQRTASEGCMIQAHDIRDKIGSSGVDLLEVY